MFYGFCLFFFFIPFLFVAIAELVHLSVTDLHLYNNHTEKIIFTLHSVFQVVMGAGSYIRLLGMMRAIQQVASRLPPAVADTFSIQFLSRRSWRQSRFQMMRQSSVEQVELPKACCRKCGAEKPLPFLGPHHKACDVVEVSKTQIIQLT